MTNEIIVPGLELAGSTNNPQFINIVCDGGPMGPALITAAWMLLLLLLPVLCICLLIRSWRRKRSGAATPWTCRLMLIAALTMAMATVATVLIGVHQVYMIVATTDLGAAGKAMWNVNMANTCILLLIGAVASAMCLLCALCLPIKGAKENSANQSSEGIPRKLGNPQG